MAETEIKICGLSTAETVDAAVAAGATHIGLNLYEPSPRNVPLDKAVALRRRVPRRVKVALVMVGMDADATKRAIETIEPQIVQFHGPETPEWLAMIRGKFPIELWKAIGVRDADSLQQAASFKGVADRVLFDAAGGSMPGGSGLAIDWALLANFRHALPWGLAGGLTPANVAEAIRTTRAPLVDTSSGVESAPGVKDVDLIRAFCKAARQETIRT
jgi:phosphoribosylanthranilate isomerase